MATDLDEATFRLGADTSKLDGQLTTARSKLKRFGDSAKADLAKSFRGAFDTLKDLSGFGQIAGLGLAAKKFVDFDKSIANLQRTSKSSRPFIAGLRSEINEIASRRGISPEKVVEGLQAFVDGGGKIETARQALDAFALASKATGTNMEDLAKSSEDISGALGIQGGQFKQMFEILSKESEGAGSMKEFSEAVAGLAPEFARMGASGVKALSEIGAIVNVVGKNFNSPTEAAAALGALIDQLRRKSGDLSKHGISVFGPDGKMRSLQAIAGDIRTKTGGDEQKIIGLLGAKGEGIKALMPLLQGGGEIKALAGQGVAANELEDFVKESSNAATALSKFTSQLEAFVLEHPLGAIGTGIGLKVGASLLGTAASALLPKLLPSLFGGAGGAAAGALAGAAGAGGAVPVFVTNWQGGGGGIPGGLGGLIPGAAGGVGTAIGGAGLGAIGAVAAPLALAAATGIPAILAAADMNKKLPQIRSETESQLRGQEIGRVRQIINAEARSGGTDEGFKGELGTPLFELLKNDPRLAAVAKQVHGGFTADEAGVPQDLRKAVEELTAAAKKLNEGGGKVTIDPDANLKLAVDNHRDRRRRP